MARMKSSNKSSRDLVVKKQILMVEKKSRNKEKVAKITPNHE